MNKTVNLRAHVTFFKNIFWLATLKRELGKTNSLKKKHPVLNPIHLVMLEKRIHWTEIRPRAGYNFAGLYEWILYEALAGRPIVWIPLMFQTASGCRVTVCGREGRLTAQFDLDLNWYSRSTRRINPKLRGHLQFQSARSARWVSLIGSEDAFCCWGEHHLILPYPILWRASVSPCPSAPPGFCFAVLFLSRWHISVWIISLLQEAAAPTIFMCVCARLPGRAHARAASFLPRLLDAWCLRGRFKAATAMKGGEEKRGDGGKGGCMRMVNERESSRLWGDVAGLVLLPLKEPLWVFSRSGWGCFCSQWPYS